MSAPAAVLRVVVDTNAGPAERKLSKFEQRLSRTSAAAKKFSHGVDIAALATAGLATYGLGKAIESGVKFERQLSTLGAISQATGGQMKRLENQALKLGESTIYTAKQVAEAQTELAKGGLTTKQILGGGTKAALTLAAAGQLELAEAADTTVNVMKLFNLRAKDAGRIADTLATAANRTTADVSDFAMALKQGGSVAKLAGMNLSETVTTLEALAEAGIKNSDAGTSLKTFFQRIGNPSKKAREAMDALNLSLFTQEGKLKKLPAVAGELQRAFGHLTKEQFLQKAGTIAGTDAIRTLYALYTAGPAKLEALERANKKQGTAQEVAAKQTKNFQGELEQLQGAAETLGIRVFQVMRPALQEAVKWASLLTQEVSAVFADDTLSGPKKFQEAFGLIFDKLVPLFETAMTNISEAATTASPKAAAAFVRGFMNAGPWAKLFSLAYLWGKFGGVFRGFGQRAGAEMGKGATESGGLSGALSKGMRAAGAIAAGYFVAEFGTQVIERITGSDILEGQSLAASLTHGFNNKGVARTEQDALQKNAGLNFSKSKAQLESLQKAFAHTMAKIENDAILGMGAIQHALDTGLAQAGETWIHATPQWREHVVAAMRAAVGSIESGMAAGTIKTKDGQREINHLLAKIHLTTGKDPVGVAEGVAKSFREAGRITPGAVKAWVSQLAAMPKGARESARETMSNMLKAWAEGHPKIEKQVESLTAFEARKFGGANKALTESTNTAMREVTARLVKAGPKFREFSETGLKSMGSLESGTERAMSNIATNVSEMMKSLHLGKAPNFNIKKALNQLPELPALPKVKKQRGGPINLGAPSGDSVPAMLERGEYVLNRNAVSKMGKKNLDAINFGSAPRFQKGGLAAEPQLGGSGPLHDIGQGAVHKVYAAADKMLEAARAQASATGAPGFKNGTLTGKVSWFNGGATAGGSNTSFPGVALNLKPGTEGGWDNATTRGWMADSNAGHPDYVRVTIAGHTANLPITDLGPAGFTQRAIDVTEGGVKKLGLPLGGFPTDSVGTATLLAGRMLGGLVGYLAGGVVGAKKGNPWNPKAMRTSPSTKPLIAAGEGYKPKTIGRIKSKAEQIANAFTGYIWGGGHGEGTHVRANGLDCSGAVAKLMQESGWSDFAVGVSNEYASRFTPGVGDLFTIWSNADHTFANIEGKDWGTNTTNGLGYATHTHSGFTPVHPVLAPEKGTKAAAEHTYKEDVPHVYDGLKTGNLSFGSIPKSLNGVAKELKQRRAEARKYRAAIKKAEGRKRPAIVQALQHCLQEIEKRINELTRAQHKLRIEKAKRKFSGKLGEQLGKLTGFATPIALAERAFNSAQQFATQTVELEPIEKEDGDGSAIAGWINEKEMPAYAELLAKAADWRNTVLSAERFAAGRWEDKGPLGGLEGNWETKILNTDWQIKASERIIEKARKDRDRFAKQHPKAKKIPEWLQGENKAAKLAKESLPLLAFQDKELRTKLGEAQAEFYPGGSRIKERPTPPIGGSGALEQALENVQGIHWPGQHEKLAQLPGQRVRGKFGGVIWDVQTQMAELGLKLSEALDGSSGSSASEGTESSVSESGNNAARIERLEEMLRESAQRELVYQRQAPILERFAGFHAKGGFIPEGMWGIAGEAGPEIVHGPAQVYSNSDSTAMAGGGGVARIVIEDHRVRVYDRSDQEIESVVLDMNKRQGRAAKTVGGKRAGRGI